MGKVARICVPDWKSVVTVLRQFIGTKKKKMTKTTTKTTTKTKTTEEEDDEVLDGKDIYAPPCIQ